MRLKSLLFALLFSVVLSHRAMADFDYDSAPNSEKSESSKPVNSSVVSPTTKETATTEAETTTEMVNQITHNTENTTEEQQIGGKATEDENLFNGSFVDEATTETSTEKSSNAEGKANEKVLRASTIAAVDITVVSTTTKENTKTEPPETITNKQIREGTEKTTEELENIITKEPIGGEKSPGVEAGVFTPEVIAAVVLGAVCVVMLIAFLVYRLRKCDEGSYVLSDAGYEDPLQGDVGKEAFV